MKGTCLCGAVSIIAPEQTRASVCHCSMCRRWAGGPLGDDVAFEFKEQIFVDSKPDFYDFANATDKMTGAEVFAKFAPGA